MVAAKVRYTRGFTEEQTARYMQLAAKTTQDIDNQIKYYRSQITLWSYLHPSQPHFDFIDKTGKHHDLRAVEYGNPLVIDVYSTMSHNDHKVLAEVAPDLHLDVNASAYDHLLHQLRSLSGLDLSVEYVIIEIQPSATIMIPRELLSILARHPWEELYGEQMKNWTQQRHQARTAFAQDPRFKVDPDT